MREEIAKSESKRVKPDEGALHSAPAANLLLKSEFLY
jgi:hypothetical protein